MSENDGSDPLAPSPRPPSGEWLPDEAADAGPRYREQSLLGQGGMGRVLAAEDPRLRRSVAIKRAHGAPDGPEAERLRREARITAALEHPGIVPVHDMGVDDEGHPYFVMRYLRGATLAETIEGATTMEERLAVVRQLRDAVAAVAHAHEAGVVHRDLKPDNILVGADGQVCVLDWGLAKTGDDASWAGVLTEGFLTRKGTVLGTVAYMAPEQASGRGAEPPADVWALGAILYEILAGEPAFPGDAEREVIASILAGARPALTERAPEAPPALVAIVDRALQQDPAERFDDAPGLLAALDAALAPTATAPQRAGSIRPLLAGVVLLGMLAAGVWVLRGDPEPDADQRVVQSALTHLAWTALRDGDPIAGDRLAARALLRGDSVDARGVMAASGPMPRPERVSVASLPSCLFQVLRADLGLVFCGTDEGLLALSPDGEVRWSSPGFVDRIQIDDAGTVLARLGSRTWAFLDPRTGESLPQEPRVGLALGPRRGPAASPGRLITLANSRTESIRWASLGEDGATGRLPTPCIGRGGVELALEQAPLKLVHFCGDNSVLDADGTELLPPTPRDSILWTADPSEDGTLVAYGGVEGDVGLLDLAAGERRMEAKLGDRIIRQVSLAPAHDRVLAVDAVGDVRVVPVAAPASVMRFASHATAAELLSDELALVLFNDRVERWRLPRAPRSHRLGALDGAVDARWSPAGLALASAQDVRVVQPDGSAHLWTLGDLPETEGDGTANTTIRFVDWNGGRPFVGGPNLGLIELRPGSEPPAVHRRSNVLALRSLRSGHAAGGGVTRDPFLLLGPDLEPIPRPFLDLASFQHPSVEASSDGSAVVLASKHPTGSLLLVRDGAPPSTEVLPAWGDCRSTLVENSGRLLCVDRDGRLLRREPDAERPEPGALWTTPLASSLALSQDERLVALGTLSGALEVWDLEERTLLLRGQGHERRIATVAFSPDGAMLVTGSWDETFRLWDLSRLTAPPEELASEALERWDGLPPTDLERSLDPP